MKLAVIPARGGSKRIPLKNIMSFCGKPMIAWPIAAALECGFFDRVIVSTDNAEIAEVARTYGAEVPFMRPDALSDDHTGTIPVIAHAIEWQQQHGVSPTAVCCIYATAPFVRSEQLRRGFDILESTGSDYAFAVTSYAYPIQRAVRIAAQGGIELLNPENLNTRSQDLEEAFHDAGQFYWGKTQAWLKGKSIFSPNTSPIVLPRHYVQDIDTQEDWELAEIMFEVINKIETGNHQEDMS